MRRGFAAQPAGRAQVPAPAVRTGRAVRRALPPRGFERRRAAAPERGRGVRPWDIRRGPLHRDGVRGGGVAQGPDRARSLGARGSRDRPPGAGGREVRARARHRPPRPEAAERSGRLGGASTGDRLRDRPRRRLGDHPDRVGARNGAVPVARAGSGAAGHGRVGHLLGRRDALRGAHRTGAVRCRLPGHGGPQAGLRAPAAAERAEPRGLARPRRSGACGPWPRTR